ncbi:cytokine receptor common subunit gamma-like isoform X2 [Boleophthalmus pectinirostris]|uniref:cytokine receptor common subunit gamma-like isoform X2 n=1 Tax=Boleophthalmus pectinirostris TaxID=150288 RepID=UPI002432DC6E|nr:cytokine receptor common subunit gamma-like isoform X2 [Boleophthalmus pectinirostris]
MLLLSPEMYDLLLRARSQSPTVNDRKQRPQAGGLEATVACGDDEANLQQLSLLNTSGNTSLLHIDPKSDVICLLYPTHEVNCSWSLESLEMKANVTTTISICNGDKTMQTQESKISTGSHSSLIEKTITELILHFNISLHDQWAVYYYKIDNESLVLPPPPDVKGSFKDNDLFITWGLPFCQIDCSNGILEYELHISDQEKPKYVMALQSYTEPNVDLTQSYTVTIRTRVSEYYAGSHHWSDWSHPVTIEAKQLTYQLTAEMIIAISVGIPMILLALLLVVCQRLSKRLFPPIPSPPPRYLHVLQNGDHFVSPDLAVKPDEEITLVFYSENEKTHKSRPI